MKLTQEDFLVFAAMTNPQHSRGSTTATRTIGGIAKETGLPVQTVRKICLRLEPLDHFFNREPKDPTKRSVWLPTRVMQYFAYQYCLSQVQQQQELAVPKLVQQTTEIEIDEPEQEFIEDEVEDEIVDDDN